jgi:PAS domain S-box-containing protein
VNDICECKVLVVDDDENFRGILSRQLSRLGCSCVTAENGEMALEAMKTGDFDVAFIDLIMSGMGGIEVLRHMGEADLDTVPVVLSGHTTISTAVEAMRRGAFDYLEKETDMDILHSIVERAVEQRRTKHQARSMSEAARQWEATFDAVPDLMAIIDTEHRFVRVNKAMAEKLGCTAQEAVGRTCAECAHCIDDSRAACLHTVLLKDSQDKVASITDDCPGGHFHISTSPLHDAEGELIGCVHVARDITQEKAAEERLRKANMETERLLSSMSSFLIEVDMELRVCRWNAAAENTFGILADEVLGKPIADSGIKWNWDDISKDIPKWLSASEVVRLPEMRHENLDGIEGVLGITANPIKNEAGESAGFFLLGADITLRKTLESQLVQAQKLESIGQLAAGIAHEINTPTQYVGDNIEFLQCAFEQLDTLRIASEKLLESCKEGAIDDNLIAATTAATEDANVEYLATQVPRAITQSLDGVGRIASIVRAMKEFSHPGSENKTRIDLNHAIESTITVSRNEWKYVADVETDFDASLPPVLCLPGEFNQVVLNILVNAAHAIADVVDNGSKGKGTITVSTRHSGEWAEIRIKDTGSGIPEKARSRIFDPFYTTKEVGKGTGQGLAIAHNVIADKHDGSLTFETELGKGTTFIIRLPILEE